jgi:hypothetical protein
MCSRATIGSHIEFHRSYECAAATLITQGIEFGSDSAVIVILSKKDARYSASPEIGTSFGQEMVKAIIVTLVIGLLRCPGFCMS